MNQAQGRRHNYLFASIFAIVFWGVIGLTGQAKSGEAATFTYDAVGNTLLKWQQSGQQLTFTYDAANRILTQTDGSTLTTMTYDGNGNLTEENAAGTRTTNVYDNENRLTNIKFSNGTRSTYTYNGDGLRRSRNEAGGGINTVIWDGTDYLMEKN